MLKIFKEHAELNGEEVTLYEAAVLMAQALVPLPVVILRHCRSEAKNG